MSRGGGKIVTTASGGPFKPGVSGLRLSGNGTSGYADAGPIGNYPSKDFFIAFKTFIASSASSPVIVWKGNYGSTNGFFFQVAGTIIYVWADSSFLTLGGFTAGVEHDVVVNFVYGGALSIYVDGSYYSDGGSHSIATWTSNLQFLAYNSGAANHFDGGLFWYGSGPGTLSETEAKSLMRNGWCRLFAPQRSIIPASVAAGGTPTLTALTASNITTSGWRATLTAA